MKKLTVVALVAVFLFFSAYAGGTLDPGMYRRVAVVTNVSGLGTDVVDVTSATLNDTLGYAGRKVYSSCTARLRITALAGTAPNAVIKIDQSYDLGNTYEDNGTTFTACTTTCDETKLLLLGATFGLSYPSYMQIKHTTTGTSVTDLDYEIYLMCKE